MLVGHTVGTAHLAGSGGGAAGCSTRAHQGATTTSLDRPGVSRVLHDRLALLWAFTSQDAGRGSSTDSAAMAQRNRSMPQLIPSPLDERACSRLECGSCLSLPNKQSVDQIVLCGVLPCRPIPCAVLCCAVVQFLMSQKNLGLTDISKATITEKSVRLNYIHGIWYQVSQQ